MPEIRKTIGPNQHLIHRLLLARHEYRQLDPKDRAILDALTPKDRQVLHDTWQPVGAAFGTYLMPIENNVIKVLEETLPTLRGVNQHYHFRSDRTLTVKVSLDSWRYVFVTGFNDYGEVTDDVTLQYFENYEVVRERTIPKDEVLGVPLAHAIVDLLPQEEAAQ